MTDFTARTLALADDDHDEAHASNGYSRYGAYLNQHASSFSWSEGEPLDSDEFAAAAWRIATTPVMAPGYVRIRPDLCALRPEFTEDDELVLRVDVPLRQRALTCGPVSLADWTTAYDLYSASQWRPVLHPEPGRRGALLVTATLLIPVPRRVLPVPTGTGPGPVLAMEAKAAVHALVQLANAHAHLVADLLAGHR